MLLARTDNVIFAETRIVTAPGETMAAFASADDVSRLSASELYTTRRIRATETIRRDDGDTQLGPSARILGGMLALAGIAAMFCRC
jgi:hypothetical protein